MRMLPMSFEASIATIGKGIPIGRMGTAQEYANLVPPPC